MIDLLLDTNIVIYLSHQERKTMQFVQELGEQRLGISIMTYMETLVGADSPEDAEHLDDLLSLFSVMTLTQEIARKSAATLRAGRKKSLRNPRLADIIIAHTALTAGVPLVTNNPKDFRRFSSLQLLTPPS